GLYNGGDRPAGVLVFDVATGKPRGPLISRAGTTHPSGYALVRERYCSVAADGKTVLSFLDSEWPLRPGGQRWDVATGKPVGELIPGDRGRLGGGLLLIRDTDGSTLRLHDAATGTLRQGGLLTHRAPVVAHALSKSGRYAVSATADR